jgi:hypothetical protein
MHLLTNNTVLALWQNTIKDAENQCSISLQEELETYLVSLLMDYTYKPEIVKQLFAASFLDAYKQRNHHSLRQVGDQCLLFAGLFPHAAERKLVKISYFVDLGRSAYASISGETNDLFRLLAYQFVGLMDVLQSIRPHPDLLPLEAYEQWTEVGSQRALRILREYSNNGTFPR